MRLEAFPPDPTPAGSLNNSPRPDHSTLERTTRSGFLYRSKSFAKESARAGAGLQGGWSDRWNRRGEISKLRLSGVVAGLLLAWFVLSRIIHLSRKPFVPCNPFQSPGRLVMNLTSPLHTLWLPLNPKTCPPLPPYLPALWHLTHGEDRKYPTYPASTFPEEYVVMSSEPLPPSLHPLVHPPRSKAPASDPVAFLRKKRPLHPPTVLVLGDSVDRNGLVHFCQLFKRNVTISHYHDIRQHPPGPYPPDLTRGHGPKFDGWDQRGLMHMCEIPFYDDAQRGRARGRRADEHGGGGPVAMRILNGFHYGMDELDEFNTPDHTDWHAPGKIEKRIDKLVMRAVEQLGGPDKIDLVQLHSGMWDLALFGMQDDKHRFSLTTPLSPEQLAWWQERMLHTIYHVRQRFPKARLIFRKLHRTDDTVAGTQYITNLYVNLGSRVNQLRHLQEEIARSEGLPIFDFNIPLEGYQLFQEKVHPLMIPGGVIYAQNIVHQLRLALESKSNWRRGWLSDA